ncbi:MAG: type II toxin-antitoxin system RelE/ParE family toxin [Bacteroidetes bacterium]|nr:type II toxin-antitoxin system RelE/ParE family toxin [Bacteroidota bacterium]
MAVRFLRAATEDLVAAAQFYENESIGLGSSFLDAIERSLSWIEENPEIGMTIDVDLRRFNLVSFPFAIVYSVEVDTIVVVAISHHRRLPDWWKSRPR